MKNANLAIAIPTYNRSEMLCENILLMLGEIKEYSIPIYVSDNSTNNDTEELIEKIKVEYEYLYYFKNITNIGPDQNFIKTLSIPNEKYVWFLGDSMIIKSGGIEAILKLIASDDFDFISVNAEGRDVDIPNRVFKDGNELLTKLGWHLTLLGATIYSKRSLSDLKGIDLGKCENFSQTAVIFYQFKDGYKLYWLNDEILKSNRKKVIAWKKEVFHIFLTNWNLFVNNLPDYYRPENKHVGILEHSFRTGLFSFKKILIYRSEGIFDMSVLRRYYGLLKENSRVNSGVLLLIAIFPQWLMKIIVNLLKSIRDFLGIDSG